ncbi:hypothetical protein AVEN_266071-1 [Araneus ventricosus]|uniref:Uncharacterized protein n=1 Tax=Araneus ventricosus TaxID=182803 RepID=A0A4Y2PEB5_ARAVE|nr:hypothetical protein AVEN_266071-1 [Araneus ventricosus]
MKDFFALRYLLSSLEATASCNSSAQKTTIRFNAAIGLIAEMEYLAFAHSFSRQCATSLTNSVRIPFFSQEIVYNSKQCIKAPFLRDAHLNFMQLSHSGSPTRPPIFK